jgi:hypothetical protein
VQKSLSDEGDNGLEYQHEGADLGRVDGDDANRHIVKGRKIVKRSTFVRKWLSEQEGYTRLLLGLQFRDDISMYPFGQCIYIEPD